MGVLDDTDAALDKAVIAEQKMLDATDEAGKVKYRNQANLYFKRAMINDGNEDYSDKVLS